MKESLSHLIKHRLIVIGELEFGREVVVIVFLLLGSSRQLDPSSAERSSQDDMSWLTCLAFNWSWMSDSRLFSFEKVLIRC